LTRREAFIGARITNPRALRALTEALNAAGTRLPAATTHAGVGRFPSIRAMVEAEPGGWLPVMGVHLRAGQIDVILREAETALDAYRAADGTAVFPAPAHVVVAARH
jgi:hypothetical protein